MTRVRTIAYQLDLSPELSEVHNVFHVSQLRRCISPPAKRNDMAKLELAKDLTYEERPIKKLDETERVTRSKVIKFYKVQWEHHTEEETTWERGILKDSLPRIVFPSNRISRTRFILSGGGL